MTALYYKNHSNIYNYMTTKNYSIYYNICKKMISKHPIKYYSHLNLINIKSINHNLKYFINYSPNIKLLDRYPYKLNRNINFINIFNNPLNIYKSNSPLNKSNYHIRNISHPKIFIISFVLMEQIIHTILLLMLSWLLKSKNIPIDQYQICLIF